MASELQPCPFCLGTARVDPEAPIRQKSGVKFSRVWWIAACTERACCSQTRRWATREDAILAWNRRNGGPQLADTRLLEDR